METHVTPNDDLARFVVIDGGLPVILGQYLDTLGKGEDEALGVSLVACGTCLEGTSCVGTKYMASGALVDSEDVGLPVHPLFGKNGIAAVLSPAVEQVERDFFVTEPRLNHLAVLTFNELGFGVDLGAADLALH